MALRVLVVDDDPVIRELLDAVLSHAGYLVTLAASGEAALEHLSHSVVSLVVLDVAMPRMNGLDVVAAIRRRRAAPPVVMVSARTDEETVTEALARGCSGYVAKPFKPRDLLVRLSRALSARPMPSNLD